MSIDWLNLYASSVAAIAARLATHPLDTLKTRLQASSQTLGQQTLLSTVNDVLKHETPLAFYRGLPVALVFSVPALSTYLTTYDKSKIYIDAHSHLDKTSVWNHLAAGCVAEVVSGVFWTPMEVLKNRLQTDSMHYSFIPTSPSSSANTLAASKQELTSKKTMALAREIYAEEGLYGFYKGYFVTLAVFVPYTMIYFACYEKLKLIAQQYYKDQQPNTVAIPTQDYVLPFHAYLLCSAISCSIGASVANVFDVVKTRWQISSSRSGAVGHAYHTSPTGIIQSMWQNEGRWRAFTRGMLARVIWAVPATAISMTVFELLKNQTPV